MVYQLLSEIIFMSMIELPEEQNCFCVTNNACDAIIWGKKLEKKINIFSHNTLHIIEGCMEKMSGLLVYCYGCVWAQTQRNNNFSSPDYMYNTA